MARLYAVFIAVCMVLIAGSVGAVLYLYYGFLRVEAAVIAVAGMTPSLVSRLSVCRRTRICAARALRARLRRTGFGQLSASEHSMCARRP